MTNTVARTFDQTLRGNSEERRGGPLVKAYYISTEKPYLLLMLDKKTGLPKPEYKSTEITYWVTNIKDDTDAFKVVTEYGPPEEDLQLYRLEFVP